VDDEYGQNGERPNQIQLENFAFFIYAHFGILPLETYEDRCRLWRRSIGRYWLLALTLTVGQCPALLFGQILLRHADHFAYHCAADFAADFAGRFRRQVPVVPRLQRDTQLIGHGKFDILRLPGVNGKAFIFHHLRFECLQAALRPRHDRPMASSARHVLHLLERRLKFGDPADVYW
jgi:hypothetical protein